MDRLYIVVRSDLTAGQQLAQTTHAALGFFFDNPELTRQWMIDSNYVVILSAPDEQTLHNLIEDADWAGIVSYDFRESDLNDELTAVAFQPGSVSRQICANLPLAGREASNV